MAVFNIEVLELIQYIFCLLHIIIIELGEAQIILCQLIILVLLVCLQQQKNIYSLIYLRYFFFVFVYAL